MEDLKQGLAHIHSKNLVHGCLKGSSILVDNQERAVIGTFALTVAIGELEPPISMPLARSHFPGFVHWMAPELLSPETFGVTASEARSPASDLYSLGMAIYEMMALRMPFHGEGIMKTTMCILEGRRPLHPGEDADASW